MRSPAWMVVYAVVLVLLGATYGALIFAGPNVALILALTALVAIIATVAVVFYR